MNLKFLIYNVKSKVLAGIRRIFLSITFLFTPIQLTQFLYWKFFKSKKKLNTQHVGNSSADQGAIREKRGKSKVAIIVHVFYVDIGIEILQQVQPKSNYFDKILITHSMTPDVLTKFQSNVPHELLSKTHFMIVENRFRDCGPFIQAAASPYLSDCDVFLKLHTKKSPHLPNNEGSAWRRDLIDGLLNPKDIESLIKQLSAQSKPLWACPEHWISAKSEWGYNSFQVWKLTKILGVLFLGPQPFPVGNMYWLNTSALRYFQNLKYPFDRYSDTKDSKLKDGAFTHAIERLPSQLI